MTERVQVVVIGGGVIGCAILHEFARRGIAGLLVDAEPDVCEGTSKANSAILHTGFDSKPGTIESRMLRRAAALWPETIDALSVPFLPVGALMLARTGDDARRLSTEIARNAAVLGVTTEFLDRGAVREVAPYLADDVTAALSIPDEGVLDPFWLTRAYAEAAIAAGAEVRLGHAVVGLEIHDDEAVLELDDGTHVRAEQVVDAAGLRADEIARLAGDDSFAISPRKGQFLVSEETFGVDRIVLPIPGPLGKGMLVTPIVFGGLLLGPSAVDGIDKDDRSTDPAERERILATCRGLVPALTDAAPIRQFAGLRHVSSTGDFIVRPSAVGDRLTLAAGIRSTGISTSPAVAEAVVADVVDRRGWKVGSRRRPLSPPPTEFPERPGEIVCLCRSIGRGEIEAACRRPIQARTLDGLKRRGGATFGDCQGNLCALDVAGVAAAELGLQVTAVEKHRRGSWLWETIEAGAAGADIGGTSTPREGTPGPAPAATSWDVIVVGGGGAGRAAAEATTEAGLRVLVIDRAVSTTDTSGSSRGRPLAWFAGSTVVGLSQTDDRWLVLAQSAGEAVELTGAAVIVATGAYVEPREHRAIAGPRPAGIMTADLARRLLAAGLRPGRQVAFVGAGSAADDLAAALARAGGRVIRLAAVPDEVHGDARLDAVRLGSRWVEVDSLVLADRLVPVTFLFRSLGLVDGRPGTPLPVDGGGRLPLDGLWAAGCCVTPAIDHQGCAEAGRLVGLRVAAALTARPVATT